MTFSLGHIPCPAGSRCTAFKCLFGHGKSKETNADAREIASDSQDAPRKRTKVEGNGDISASEPAKLKKVQPGKTDDKSITITKRISPPPLGRHHASTPSASVVSTSSGSSMTRQIKKPGLPALASSSSLSLAATPSRKPESLNPRLLKHSPASHEIRFKLLNLLHAEYVRLNNELRKDPGSSNLILTPQELIFRALDEEQKTATDRPAVYTNVMKNRVMSFKKMKVAAWKCEREQELPHEKNSKKRRAMDDEPKKLDAGLSPTLEVEILRRVLTPINGLSQFGYVSSIPQEEDIRKARDGKEASQGWEKCDRCQQRFQVFPGRRSSDGALTSGGTCTFHWGKPYIPTKPPGDKTFRAKRYRCCGEDVGESSGCFTRDHHVYKASAPNVLATTLNFEKTPENELPPSDRAVAFDCEMAYTVHGLELIRLTAVSWPKGETLLDVLVRPIGEILDLNSRFSGVWPQDMANAKPWSAVPDPDTTTKNGSKDGDMTSPSQHLRIVSSPVVARELLFSLLRPDTPLIGHGLENDLNATRVVHPTVVDTVLLYPHKAGLPARHSLKLLTEQHLGRRIQQDTAGGHDSAEDAIAAGDLVRLKVVDEWEKMRRLGWKVVKGKLQAPIA